MTDRTEAMDNLIAQDADLIEMTDDLVQRLREMGEHPCRVDFPIGADLREAADRIEALSAENERLRVEVKAQYDRGYYDGRKMDAMEERAKIVAWLWGMGLHNINDIADQIEAGEHLQEQSK